MVAFPWPGCMSHTVPSTAVSAPRRMPPVSEVKKLQVLEMQCTSQEVMSPSTAHHIFNETQHPKKTYLL